MRQLPTILAFLLLNAGPAMAQVGTSRSEPQPPPQKQAPPPAPNLLLPPGTIPVPEQTALMLMVYLSDRPGTAAQLKLELQTAAARQQQSPAACPVTPAKP